MRPGPQPILHLRPQAQISPAQQRSTLDLIQQLNRDHLEARDQDDELSARLRAYELAYRMQSAAPALVDLSGETPETQSLYGLDQKETQDFGRRCLLARRLLERGVRFVQLFHRGWDQHGGLPSNLPKQCHDIDQPQAALIRDLQQRGLLDDTLVVWGGEFGRTVYGQGGLQADYGRDHHGRCFSVWLAGGGIRGHVRAIVERFRPGTAVLSQLEIAPKARIRTVGTV